MARKNNEVSRRLSAFGMSEDDLTREELAQAKKYCKSGGTGGFLSSEELISKSFKKRVKHGK